MTVAHYLGLIRNGSTAPRSGSRGGRPWRAVPEIDGGGSLILVSAERARDFPQKPVYFLGTGESVETPMVSQMADFTSSRAFRVAGPKAFAEAGITHSDVDHLMIYDAPVRRQGQASRIGRSTAPRISALCRAAKPGPSSPSATPPGACSPAARS
jgi:hypothetical protein